MHGTNAITFTYFCKRTRFLPYKFHCVTHAFLNSPKIQIPHEGCARSKYAVQFDIKLLQKLSSKFLFYVSNCVDERR